MNTNGLLIPNVGDILSRPKFPFVHKGVYVGNGLVVHNTPEHGEHVSSVVDFAANQTVSVTPIPQENRNDVMHQAAATLANPKPYDPIVRNCEHTVTRITKGREYSWQLFLVGAAVLGLVLIVFAKRS